MAASPSWAARPTWSGTRPRACYGSGPRAKAFAARPIAEQIAIAKGLVETLHPRHSAVVVNWSKIPFNLGPWPAYGGRGGQEGHIDDPSYRLLNEPPNGRVYFTGTHLSRIPGWQEGAVFSAHRTIGLLASRVAQTAAVEKLVRSAAA
jgi:monoamine oxidase